MVGVTAGRRWMLLGFIIVATVALYKIRMSPSHEMTELSSYFRPQTAVYREPGGFSHKTGRYPVDRDALAAYLRHQPHSNLRQLQEREQASHGERGRTTREWTHSGSDASEASDAHKGELGETGKALKEYLQHQNKARRMAIGELGEREKAHRSRVQALALEILGTAKRARNKLQEYQGEHEGKGDIMKVLRTLQSEISLDTEAISAFRDEMSQIVKDKGKSKDAKKLGKMLSGMENNNKKLASKVEKLDSGSETASSTSPSSTEAAQSQSSHKSKEVRSSAEKAHSEPESGRKGSAGHRDEGEGGSDGGKRRGRRGEGNKDSK